MKNNRLLKLCLCLLIALLPLTMLAGASAEVEFPSDLVRIEANAFKNASLLTGELDLPDGLTYIGAQAFYNCKGLTGRLLIPAGVTTIGSQAFAYCTGLTGNVVLPPSVTSVARDAFVGTSLKVLNWPGDGGGTDLPGGDDDGTDVVVTMTDLPEGLSWEITNEGAIITRYTGAMNATLRIPASISGIPVVAIGDRAFQHCSELTGSITLPQTLKRIGDSAFSGCVSLSGPLTIPSNVTEIGNYAFYECLSLSGSLKLPSSVRSVGRSAFAFCEGMTGSLTLPASISLGERCFQGAGFTGSISIPASVKLGPNVFAGSRLNVTYAAPGFTYTKSGSGLTLTGWNGPVNNGLTIPASIDGSPVTAIGAKAFADIGLRGALSIPGSVAVIGESAFNSNEGLTKLTLGQGVKSIGAYAFAGTGLSGVIELPASATNVDPTAFFGTGVTIK